MVEIGLHMVPLYSETIFISLYSQSYKELKTVLYAFYFSAIIIMLYAMMYLDASSLGDGRIDSAITDNDITEELNFNYVAGRLVFAIYIGYFLFWRFSSRVSILKYFHLLISLLMLFIIIITGSRAALGILILPIIVFFFVSGGHLMKNIFIILAVLLLLCFLVLKVPIFYNAIGVRIEDAINIIRGTDNGYEDTSRLILVMLGIEWFMQKPFLGYGINCFRLLSYKLGGFKDYYYAHNNYIELMVDVGIIGLFIYYFAHYSLYRSYKQIRLRKKKVGVVVITLLVAMLFSDLFWVGYYNNLSQFLLCTSFAITHIERKDYYIKRCSKKSQNT